MTPESDTVAKILAKIATSNTPWNVAIDISQLSEEDVRKVLAAAGGKKTPTETSNGILDSTVRPAWHHCPTLSGTGKKTT